MPNGINNNYIGLMGTAAPGTAVANINAAGTWHAASFVLPAAKTLSKVRAYIDTVTGSLSAGEVSCGIYADSGAGQPAASALATVTTTTGALGAGWVEWTGFSQALTANTSYWIVWKNLNASPASNYLKFRAASSGSANFFVTGTAVTFGWARKSSNDSGATWAFGNIASGGTCLRLEFSDATFAGLPIENVVVGAIGQRVYGTREVGVKFTAPGPFNISGLGTWLSRANAPAQPPRFKLYQVGVTAPLATTTGAVLPAGTVSTFAHFSSFVTLVQGQAYRAVLCEDTNSDLSSTGYNVWDYTVENTAASLALVKYGGNWQRTYWDGAAWTDTANIYPEFALLLDDDNPVGAAGLGGAVIGSSFIRGVG